MCCIYIHIKFCNIYMYIVIAEDSISKGYRYLNQGCGGCNQSQGECRLFCPVDYKIEVKTAFKFFSNITCMCLLRFSVLARRGAITP